LRRVLLRSRCLPRSTLLPYTTLFRSGDPRAIEGLTKAAGFRYVWDDTTHQFAHPTGVIVLTPDGHLARYLFGIEYGARNLRFALDRKSTRLNSSHQIISYAVVCLKTK